MGGEGLTQETMIYVISSISNQFQQISLLYFRKKFNEHGKKKKGETFIWIVLEEKGAYDIS